MTRENEIKSGRQIDKEKGLTLLDSLVKAYFELKRLQNKQADKTHKKIFA